MQTGPSSSFDREVTLLASHYIQDTRKNLAKPRSFAGHSTHQKEYQSTRRKTFVSPITPMGDSLPHSKNSSCGCSLIRNEQRKAIFIVQTRQHLFNVIRNYEHYISSLGFKYDLSVLSVLMSMWSTFTKRQDKKTLWQF